MRVAADSLEARAYRESESLRGTELDGRIERAVPLVIGNDKAIGVVTVVGRQGTAEPTLQRETDLELTGYLHQAARAMHDVHTREDQLLRIAKLEQERTAQELRMAREIQESFLPEVCPALPGWEFAADWRAAREVGGDFYDFLRVDDEHVGLVIADVSDKGVPAALFMSLSWTLLRVAASESTAPAKVLERMNELLMTESRSGMFLTLFYGVLNWRTGHLTYARAGHNPPILFRAQGPAPASHTAIAQHQAAGDTHPRGTRRLEQTVVTLMPDGTALGVQDGLTWAEEQVQMRPGDILILYTDGVTEPINPRGVEFGEERLIEAVRTNSLRPCAEIVDLIGESVARFVGDQAQFDDYTLVGLKRQALPQG
jgi:sigma-B regulation protein RsbU (phosphoserine phosphatase)